VGKSGRRKKEEGKAINAKVLYHIRLIDYYKVEN
jgi:hypothetical protein